MKKTAFAAAAACVLVLPVYAANGIVVSLKSTANGGQAVTNQIQIDPNHMRAEVTSPTGAKSAVMFDGAKQVMDIVDVEKKTYFEITKSDVDAIAGQLSSVMSQMQQQMANLPPDQRARVEAMMKGRGMPGTPTPAPKPVYKKTGSATVGKWKCDVYEGYEGERKTSEVCAASPSALGLTDNDFAISKQVAEFFGKMFPQRANEMFSIGTIAGRGYDGVPVRTTIYGEGGRVTTTELTDVSRQNIPESTFAVPAGFQKMDSPFAGRGRRGGQ
jgi:hypothetical protein